MGSSQCTAFFRVLVVFSDLELYSVRCSLKSSTKGDNKIRGFFSIVVARSSRMAKTCILDCHFLYVLGPSAPSLGSWQTLGIMVFIEQLLAYLMRAERA